MSLLLVCGAVFIGKEGRSSKSPPSVVPSRPPLPPPSSALEGTRGVLSPSVVPPPGLALSSLRLRQPDTSLRIASLTPCFGVRLLSFSPGARHPPSIPVRTVKKVESALVALFALGGNEVPDMSAVMILRHGSKRLNVPPLHKAQYIVAVREGKILIGSNACSRFFISSPLRLKGKIADVFPSAARMNACDNAPNPPFIFPVEKSCFLRRVVGQY